MRMINTNYSQTWTPPKDSLTMNMDPRTLIVFNSGKPFRIIEYVFNNIIDTYCHGLVSMADTMMNSGYNLVSHGKEMMIEISSFKRWLKHFMFNLRSYGESIFDDEFFCDYKILKGEFYFYIKYIKTDELLEEIILKDGEFIYKDEFGEVLNEQYLSTFLRKLTEIHPGIEIPELNWNCIAYYEKCN